MKRFIAIGEAMLELSAAADNLWKMGIAGDSLNTLWYARPGLPEGWQTAFVTAIGIDDMSGRLLDFLSENGISTERIIRHPDRIIGLYAIQLEEGERRFTYWRDRSAARCLAEDPERLDQLIRGADLLYFSGISLAILPEAGRQTLLQAVAKIRQQGGRVAFDPNYRPALWENTDTARKTIEAAARLADFLLPSFADEAACFGDADPAVTLDRYQAWGAMSVIVKNAGGPIQYFHAGQRGDSGPLPRQRPLDSTAAGDRFNGAFLAALLQGAPIAEAIQAGHHMASRVICYPGALLPLDQLG
jgi:2-dehydro-3-deoxygluconokinase